MCCLPQSHIAPTLSEVGSDLFKENSSLAFWRVSLQKEICHLEEIAFTLKKLAGGKFLNNAEEVTASDGRSELVRMFNDKVL